MAEQVSSSSTITPAAPEPAPLVLECISTRELKINAGDSHGVAKYTPQHIAEDVKEAAEIFLDSKKLYEGWSNQSVIQAFEQLLITGILKNFWAWESSLMH